MPCQGDVEVPEDGPGRTCRGRAVGRLVLDAFQLGRGTEPVYAHYSLPLIQKRRRGLGF